MTYASHTLPSLHLFTPHQLTAPPNTHCMPITYPFIIIHAIHKIPYHSIHNNNCTTCTNTIIQSPCSVRIVLAPSSQSNNQKSQKLQSNASAKQPTATSEPDLSLPHAHIQTTTCNRLLLSHLFPHNYNVSNMLHDALNRQKHLPLSTSFHASFMQHVHLELHYRHHPTQDFTGLPPRGTLLPTPIGSTHHLCMKLIHVPTEHTLPYYN